MVIKFLFYLYIVPRRLGQRKKRKKFDLFTKNYLSLTPRVYENIAMLEQYLPEANIYIAGSDQIWNTSMENGKDPSFYLDFVPKASIKASYAASFAKEQVEPGWEAFVKTKLKNFDNISVREVTGLKILESLGITNGVCVLDPVFLLSKDHWESMCKFSPVEKYIFVNDQENNLQIISIAKYIAKQLKLKIYAVKGLYPKFYADKVIDNAGPLEFLGLINKCEMCLTNSFHATAFSIIFQKDFYVFGRTAENVNSRMIDLLSLLGLEARYYSIETTDEIFANIDYTEVNKRLQKAQNQSVNYLKSILRITK